MLYVPQVGIINPRLLSPDTNARRTDGCAETSRVSSAPAYPEAPKIPAERVCIASAYICDPYAQVEESFLLPLSPLPGG